jgi:hypothetical protein
VTSSATRLGVMLIVCASCWGCTSPESTRTRGGGPGGDRGNRPEVVSMHGGSDPFWRTPVRIGDTAPPPLAPARHARQVSRR